MRDAQRRARAAESDETRLARQALDRESHRCARERETPEMRAATYAYRKAKRLRKLRAAIAEAEQSARYEQARFERALHMCTNTPLSEMC